MGTLVVEGRRMPCLPCRLSIGTYRLDSIALEVPTGLHVLPTRHNRYLDRPSSSAQRQGRTPRKPIIGTAQKRNSLHHLDRFDLWTVESRPAKRPSNGQYAQNHYLEAERARQAHLRIATSQASLECHPAAVRLARRHKGFRYRGYRGAR
ncbi:hypothetical protein ACQPW1_30450 [Nocardia sp. CA-128927]|uniref:hypothetical protein n=1 Tax=Nocardia sp. CA-128927 TaxID=3239975 RepID=UPI003D96E244